MGIFKNEYKWPECSPVDKSDASWEINNNLNVNGIQYLKVEYAPGKWRYEVDQELMKLINGREDERKKLRFDLQTRVLSEDEMSRVMKEGVNLFIDPMSSYYELDKIKQFNEAICQQYRLRAIVKDR